MKIFEFRLKFHCFKFVPKGPVNNIPALDGAKPLSESMLVRLPTHICVARPQWVKIYLWWTVRAVNVMSSIARCELHLVAIYSKMATSKALQYIFHSQRAKKRRKRFHVMTSSCCDVTMGSIASQITSITIVYSIIYSDQRKHQSSTSLAFVRGIHRGPVNSPHKWPVTRKKFPFDDVIMIQNVTVDTFALVLLWHFALMALTTIFYKGWTKGTFLLLIETQ